MGMRLSLGVAAVVGGVVIGLGATGPDAATQRPRDPAPHRVLFVDVAPDTRIEVLDWGGTGRPIMLLAGLGHSAHVFDSFALRVRALSPGFHVLGMSRRGYGESSRPETGYAAAQLADDVLHVLDALRIVQPVLIGHSIAGEELSYLGAHHGNRVSGLVYLDAAYDRTDKVNMALYSGLPEWMPDTTPADDATVTAHLAWVRRIRGIELPAAEVCEQYQCDAKGNLGPLRIPGHVPTAIFAGVHAPDYRSIPVPALAFYAVPLSGAAIYPYYESGDASWRAAVDSWWAKWLIRGEHWSGRNEDAFRQVRRSAVIEVPNGNHYLFLANEAIVLAGLHEFLNALGR